MVEPVQTPISPRKPMLYGTRFYDGGNFILSKTETESILANESRLKPYVKRVADARSMLYGKEEKYCLYLNNVPDFILENQFVSDRIKRREEFLQKNGTRTAIDFLVRLKNNPHQQLYHFSLTPDVFCLAVPKTSSVNRVWIPALFASDAVVNESMFIISFADNVDFAIVSSKMHMLWAKIIAGRMKYDLRYSISLIYNTFPLPIFDGKSKFILKSLSQDVLDTRSSDMNLASQYNPDTMPDSLKQAHKRLDSFFERMYFPDGFQTDTDRLFCLLRMYEEKTRHNPVDIDQWC